MSRAAPRRWADAGVLSLALAAFVAPSASAAEAGWRTPQDRAAILSVHAKLAAMGYPVSADQSDWNRNSDYSVRRMLIRLGEEERSLTPAEAAARLGDLDPVAGPPCPERPASRDMTVEDWRDVTVTFAGERPEEYLADFYLRLAECRPELLKAAPAPQPSRLAPASMVSPGFPISRTERSAASYRRLGSMLAKEIAFSGGDLAAPFAAPSLRVDLTRAFSSTAVEFSPTAARASPGVDALDPICARFGYRRGCLDVGDVEFLADDGDARGAYLAHLDHFRLTLHISLPEGEAGRIATDAVDAVRQQNKVMWGESGRDLPRSYFGPPKAAPASTTVRRSLTDTALKDVFQAFSDLRTAVGWLSEAERAHKLNANSDLHKVDVYVADPGFNHLRGDHHVSNAAEAGWGELKALKPLAEVGGSQLVKVLADEGMQEDSLGHGLHVAYLASGAGQPGMEGLSPITGPGGFYMKTDIANDLATKSDVKAEDVGPFRGAVFNKSYKLLDLCSASEGISGVNYRTLVSGDRAQLNSGSSSQNDVAKRWFDIVSAPTADGVCRAECGAQSPTAPDNVCAGKFATALAVSPMEQRPGSDEWAPFKTDRIQYVANIPMVGAPGAGIYSADMRLRNETEEFGFGKRDGSSMAAPAVTALVAHLRRIHGERFRWIDLKTWIFATATPLSDSVLNDKSNGDLSLHFGMVNFSRAMLGDYAEVNIYFKDKTLLSLPAARVIWHANFRAFHEKSDQFGKGFAIVRNPSKESDSWRRYWREKQARSCTSDSIPCFYFTADAYNLPTNNLFPGGCISGWNAQSAAPVQSAACMFTDGRPLNFNDVERIVWLGALEETPYSKFND